MNDTPEKPAKIYTSFEEIDRDLEILRTERSLYILKTKHEVKSLRKNITIGHLIEPMIDGWKKQLASLVKLGMRKALWPLLTTLLLKLLRRKKS